VQRAIYSLPAFETEDVSNPTMVSRDPRMGKAMTTKLILAKLQTGNADKRTLCLATTQTVDFLSQSFGPSDEHSRVQYVLELATAAVNALYLRDIVIHLSLTCEVNPYADQYQDNALVAAIVIGDLPLIRALLGRGAKATSRTRLFGEPLSVAARHGHSEIMQTLLRQAKGERSQLGDYYSRLRLINALETAAIVGHETIVRILLESGYAVTESIRLFDRVIKAAVRARNESLAKLLLRHRIAPVSPEVHTLYPLRCRPPNEEQAFWRELLQTAAEYGCENIARLIIEIHLDVSSEADLSHPIEDASRCGHWNVVKLLVAAYRSAKKPCPGATYWAARRGNREIVDLLLDTATESELQSAVAGALAGTASASQQATTRHILNRVAATAPMNISPEVIEDAACGTYSDMFKFMAEYMVKPPTVSYFTCVSAGGMEAACYAGRLGDFYAFFASHGPPEHDPRR